GTDIFVARFDASNGGHVWSTRFGASSDDVGNGITVDSTGVYLTGAFRRTVSFGGNLLSSGGTDSFASDGYVVKLALANASHIWSRQLGAASADIANAVSVSGNMVFVTGQFGGTANFGQTLTSNGMNDAFVAALGTSDGSLKTGVGA